MGTEASELVAPLPWQPHQADNQVYFAMMRHSLDRIAGNRALPALPPPAVRANPPFCETTRRILYPDHKGLKKLDAHKPFVGAAEP
jgi:hypothetical protein